MPTTPTDDVLDRGWEVERSPETAAPFSGIAAPLLVRADGPLGTVPGVETSEDLHVEVEACFDPSRVQYRLRKVSVTAGGAGDGGDEVTGARLRTIVPLTILRWVLPRVIEVDPVALSPAVMGFIAPEVLEERQRELDRLETIDAAEAELDWPRVPSLTLGELEKARELVEGPPNAREPSSRPRSGPSPEELRDAVIIYGIASIVRERPAQSVARVLGLHQPTANNWLKIARREGLLD